MRFDEKLCYQPKSDYADKVNVQDSKCGIQRIEFVRA